jgi:hypothetical protein
MTWPGLTQDVERSFYMFHLSSISNDKEGEDTQEIWAAPTQYSRISSGNCQHLVQDHIL